MAENNLTDENIENLTDPIKTIKTDGEEATTHSIPDQIAGIDYVKRSRASRNPWGCIRLAKITTEGGR